MNDAPPPQPETGIILSITTSPPPSPTATTNRRTLAPHTRRREYSKTAESGTNYGRADAGESYFQGQEAKADMYKQGMSSEETAARETKAKEVQGLPARDITPDKPVDKKTAENIVRAFPQMANINDGRIATLPIDAVGKILRHSWKAGRGRQEYHPFSCNQRYRHI